MELKWCYWKTLTNEDLQNSKLIARSRSKHGALTPWEDEPANNIETNGLSTPQHYLFNNCNNNAISMLRDMIFGVASAQSRQHGVADGLAPTWHKHLQLPWWRWSVHGLSNISVRHLASHIKSTGHMGRYGSRTDSRLASSQWETSLQYNAVSHWLGANLESALRDGEGDWGNEIREMITCFPSVNSPCRC